MEIKAFEIGQQFYYTGDMANSPEFGEIIEVHEPTKYAHLRYTCKFENTKTHIVEHYSFQKSVGQRFKPIEQYNAEQQEKQEQLRQYFTARSCTNS